MPEDFVVARNPEVGSTLPYLLRIPYGEQGVLLKAREAWPRTAKVYCHRIEDWPDDVEVVERVPVRSCVRRGAAIDLVLGRGRENRSQFVISYAKGGRQAIFWQTARTAKQARPQVRLPQARASGYDELEVVVDSHERYAWKFSAQKVATRRAALRAGDYGVLIDGELAAVVERKSLGDLVSSLTSGKLKYQLTDLAAVPHAAVVVEERYSRAFRHEIVRGSVIAEGLAECQVAFPTVPVVFCETRILAQEWSYRFLAAAARAVEQDPAADDFFAELTPAAPLAPPAATAAEIRAWAVGQGWSLSDRGRIPHDVRAAYDAVHPGPAEA